MSEAMGGSGDPGGTAPTEIVGIPVGRTVFISYSHSDIDVARSVHRELTALLRSPLWRARLQVLRDETTMAPGSDLPGRIQGMIDRADWYVLLLSPASARSEWVRQELEHWMSRPDRGQRVLVLALAGGLHWGNDGLTATWLPARLARLFASEPYYLTLEPSSRGDRSAVRDVAAKMAAAVLQKTPDEIAGEERRVHRVRVRLLLAVAVFMSLMTVVAVATGGLALVSQRRAQRNEVASFASYLGAQAQLRAPERPDLAAEAAVAAWKLNPSTSQWGQLLDVSGRLPSGLTAQRLPVTDPRAAPQAFSPDGSRYAVLGVPTEAAADSDVRRLVIAPADGATDPVVVDSEAGVSFTSAAWLDDGHVAVLSQSRSDTGTSQIFLQILSADGEFVTSASLPDVVPGELDLQRAGDGQVLFVDDRSVRLLEVQTDGLGQVYRRPLPSVLQDQLYGIALYTDPERALFWMTGGSLYDVFVGDLPTGAVRSWTGDRQLTGLETGGGVAAAGRLWAVDPDHLVVSSQASEESSFSGGSAFVLERQSDSVRVSSSVGTGASVSGMCVAGRSERVLSAAAYGERLLQVSVGPAGFGQQKSEPLSRVLDVGCSESGRTVFLTADGLALSADGELGAERSGVTWLWLPQGSYQDYNDDDRWLSTSVVRTWPGGSRLVSGDTGVNATSRPSGQGGRQAPERRVSACLSVMRDRSRDGASPGPLAALVGSMEGVDRVVGNCPEWEVRESSTGSMSLWHDGRPTSVEGFGRLALDATAGILVSDTLDGTVEVRSIRDGEPILVGRVPMRSGSFLTKAFMLYEGGYLVIDVDGYEMQSAETGAEFIALPVGADALVDYLCESYATGSLDDLAREPSFPGDPSRLATLGCGGSDE